MKNINDEPLIYRVVRIVKLRSAEKGTLLQAVRWRGNMYTAIRTKLDGVLILSPKIFSDERGCFFEAFSEKSLETTGVVFHACQENHIINKDAGIIRGLHFQNAPCAQAKVVRCIRGIVDDIAVDLRKGSPTYLQWVMVELSEENRRQLFLPRGFAHGVISRSAYSEIQYIVDAPYCPELDRSIRYDEPLIGIPWNCKNPILSLKDRQAPSLEQSDCNFSY